MQTKTFTATAIVCWILLCVIGCEWTPDRDNPLDPNAPGYTPPANGSVYVIVRNLTGVSPLPDVSVTLQPLGRTEYTGNNGVLLFEDVADGEYLVIAWGEQYLADTTELEVASGEIDTASFWLNSLPVFDSVRVSSHHIDLVGPSSRDTIVTVYSKVIDVDPHLPDVVVSVMFEGNTIGTLGYSQGVFSGEFRPGDFSPVLFPDVIGGAIVLTAVDPSGGEAVSDPERVIRFLDIPRGLSPSSGESVEPLPTITWDSYTVEFLYVYHIRIYDDLNNLIWDSLGISKDMTQITVTDSLPYTSVSGGPNYLQWTLEVEDNFGNSAWTAETIFGVIEP